MSINRQIPLFDPTTTPSSWSERMLPGEFAVLYSGFNPGTPTPFCTLCPSFPAAEAHAHQHVATHPAVRCLLYDHTGLGSPPVCEVRGTAFKGESEITPRFRRWVGSFLFLGGLALLAYDAAASFSRSWPAMIGTRMLIPGVVLLVIEAAFLVRARHRAAP